MKKIIAISALMTAMISANALAVGANLTFSGSVANATCTLQASDKSKTLVIPDISVASLLNSGGNTYYSQAGSTTFNFSNCPNSVSNVSATYQYSGSTYSNIQGTASGANGGVVFVVNQTSASNPSTGSINKLDGSAPGANVAVSNGAAVIPVTIGIQAPVTWDSSFPMPTAGNYSGTFNVTFKYS